MVRELPARSRLTLAVHDAIQYYGEGGGVYIQFIIYRIFIQTQYVVTGRVICFVMGLRSYAQNSYTTDTIYYIRYMVAPFPLSNDPQISSYRYRHGNMNAPINYFLAGSSD